MSSPWGSPGQSDRRRVPRVTYAFMVRYRLPGSDNAPWRVSSLYDFSTLGVRFLCELQFGQGKVIELKLSLTTAQEPLAVKAKVVWSRPRRKGQLEFFEHGMAFEPYGEDVHRILDQAVAHFLPGR